MSGVRTRRMQVVRSGRVAWLNSPPAGNGRITAESRAFGSISMSLPEAGTVMQRTSPGELLAVAHAVMMATALAATLADSGTPARELVVAVHAAFRGPAASRALVAVNLDVRGRVPGLEQEAFGKAAASARETYLRSCGMRPDLDGRLSAALIERHHQ
jgi:osmotically inducible protein OsmC